MFDQPHWQALKLKRVRYIVPGTGTRTRGRARRGRRLHERRARRRARTCWSTFTARRGCYSTASTRRRRPARRRAPSAYRPRSGASASEFPWVQDLSRLERGQPRLPADVQEPEAGGPVLQRAAQERLRTKCTVMAADVLDQSNVDDATCAAFLRYAKGKAADLGPAQLQGRQPPPAKRHWHVLATVPGQVWLTETGGIVHVRRRTSRHRRARRDGDEVHVQARRPATTQAERATVEDHAALRLPLVRRAARRALRLRAREPRRLARARR